MSTEESLVARVARCAGGGELLALLMGRLKELGLELITPWFYRGRVFFRGMEMGELNVEAPGFKTARVF